MFKFIKYIFSSFRSKDTLKVVYDSGGRRKTSLVLLHGIAATSRTWQPLIEQLDSSKYRIIALDLVGFGESIKPGDIDYSIDDHVGYIRQTLKKLRVKNVILVGHSMGALIAAHYSYLFEREVNGLIMLSPPIYITDYKLNPVARSRTDLYMKAYNFISKNKDFTIANSQFLRKLFKIEDGIDVNQDNWNSFRLSLNNTIVKQDVFSEIKKLQIPTKIIYGSLDEFLVPEVINRLSELTEVKVVKLGGVNHLLGRRFAKAVAKEICAGS